MESDARLKKAPDPNRASRESQDRVVSEDRELTDAERLDMFRATYFQEVLPDLPKIPGYHVCWCTTQNPRDTVHARLRMGYQPVTPDDIPGWQGMELKQGEYTGMIGVAEMVALKLPLRLYNLIMSQAHHEQPRMEESRLADAAEMMKQAAYQQNIGRPSEVIMEEGLAELRRPPPRPLFEG